MRGLQQVSTSGNGGNRLEDYIPVDPLCKPMSLQGSVITARLPDSFDEHIKAQALGSSPSPPIPARGREAYVLRGSGALGST